MNKLEISPPMSINSLRNRYSRLLVNLKQQEGLPKNFIHSWTPMQCKQNLESQIQSSDIEWIIFREIFKQVYDLFRLFLFQLQKQLWNMASNYPLLPGFAPTQEFKDHYKRVSAQKQQFNRDVNNIENFKYTLPREVEYNEPPPPPMPIKSTTHDLFPAKNVSDTCRIYQPEWVRLDRHVLRFYGYFKEEVVQSNTENHRKRKVKVLFYLQDNSVQINEEKMQNSGIPQGKFLKREKCRKSNGKFMNPQDFRIGEVVEIYGRNIYIYNCDEYTRQFYEKLGQPQGPAESYENDQWQTKVSTKWIPQKDAMMKDYLQKKLGGGRVTSQKQFLENDRKVLKFFCLCEGEKYIIHFFLADDTIEVRQVSIPNSGKDPFPVTFRRQKLPRKFAINQPGQTYAEDFLRAQELQVGQTLNVFGRNYYLEGCDGFTRWYYANKFGKEFPSYDRNPEHKVRDPRENIIIPPHNGIGSNQDSLGYIYRLVPKPPKKDFFKWVDQQICLRFTAKFSNPKPQDANRRFIITFYLNDDSIQIYEPPNKNSGFSEGKFLQRNQYMNQQVGGTIYQPEHLIVGYDAKINGYWFHLIQCDDFTKKWYSQNTIWEKVEC